VATDSCAKVYNFSLFYTSCALFGSLLTGTDHNFEVLHAMGFKKVMGSDYSPQAVSLALVSSSPPYLFLSSVTSVCPNVL
jgi:hypothetical protein